MSVSRHPLTAKSGLSTSGPGRQADILGFVGRVWHVRRVVLWVLNGARLI